MTFTRFANWEPDREQGRLLKLFIIFFFLPFARKNETAVKSFRFVPIEINYDSRAPATRDGNVDVYVETRVLTKCIVKTSIPIEDPIFWNFLEFFFSWFIDLHDQIGEEFSWIEILNRIEVNKRICVFQRSKKIQFISNSRWKVCIERRVKWLDHSASRNINYH